MLLLSLTVFTQHEQSLPAYYIKEYPNKDRNDSRIMSIKQDSLGFLWMGTQSGLARFDGSNFTVYQNTPLDSSTLINNKVVNIALAKDGTMYLATKGGLDKFSVYNEKFTHSYAFQESLSGVINDVYVSDKEEVWCAPKDGAIVRLESSNDIQEFKLPPVQHKEIYSSSNNIFSIMGDRFRKGKIYAFGNNTIYSKEYDQSAFSIEYEWQPDDVDNDDFFAAVQISESQFIIGTWSIPLMLVDIEEGVHYPIPFDSSKLQLDHAFVSDFGVLSSDTILVNTWQNGVFYLILEGRSMRLERLESQAPVGELISGTTIHKGQSLIALGGFNLQALLPYPLEGSIEKEAKYSTDTKCLFYSESENCLYSGGVQFFSKEHLSTKEKEVFSSFTDQGKELDFDIIEKISSYKNDNILVFDSEYSTIVSRLMLYSPKNNVFKTIFETKRDNHYESSIVDFEYDDKSDLIWLLLSDFGLITLDGNSHKIVDKIPLTNSKKSKNANKYILVTKNYVWVGSKEGLIQVDKENNIVKRIKSNPKEKHTLIGNSITFLHEMEEGRIMVGCEDKGIQIFDEKLGINEQTITIPAQLNFDVRFVYSAIPLNKDLILVTCSSGLALIDQSKEDLNFIDVAALGTNYNFWAPAVQINNGNIIMFWDNGKVTIDPSRSSFHYTLPEIKFHRLQSKSGTSTSYKQIVTNKKITLSHTQNVFNVIFDVIDFLNPEKLMVKYQLHGVDDVQRDGTKNKQAYYTNLVPGVYTFEVVAWTKGAKEKVSKSFEIEILPAFWQTWWFALVILMFIAGLIYALIRYKENEAIKRAKIRSEYDKALAEMEMQALRSQMNPHFLFNSLNSIKYYVIQENKRKAALYIDNFSKLIRLILQNSRKSLIPLTKELEALDLYIKVEQLRFENAFEYQMNLAKEVEADYIKIPPLLIQPYIENAIWHGLLHLDKKGKLCIDIEVNKEDLKITIEDNGIGRAKSMEMQQNRKSHKESLGMKLTKDRMLISESLHNMKITSHITDLFSNGKPSGTKVVLNISKNITTS